MSLKKVITSEILCIEKVNLYAKLSIPVRKISTNSMTQYDQCKQPAQVICWSLSVIGNIVQVPHQRFSDDFCCCYKQYFSRVLVINSPVPIYRFHSVLGDTKDPEYVV